VFLPAPPPTAPCRRLRRIPFEHRRRRQQRRGGASNGQGEDGDRGSCAPCGLLRAGWGPAGTRDQASPGHPVAGPPASRGLPGGRGARRADDPQRAADPRA